MIPETYEELADVTMYERERFILIMEQNDEYYYRRHYTWLRLMGLIETWDII